MPYDDREESHLDLPSLPKGWKWRSLSQFVQEDREICYGIVQPGRHDPNGVPMVNTGDIQDALVNPEVTFRVSKSLSNKFKRSVLQGNEVLLTLVGANFGRVAVAPKAYLGFNCSRAVGVIPVARESKYIMHALRTPLVRSFMDNWANTTAQPTFNLGDVARLPVVWAPESDRKKISGFLNTLEEKIHLNHKINQTLEQMAQAIFKSWFVDFEPVKAKIATRDAGGSEEDALLASMQAISGKDKAELTRLQAEQPEQYVEIRATAELFPSAMQDSELGKIPVGWNASHIGKEVTVVGGGTPSTKNPDYWENGHINWSSPKDLSNLADKVLTKTERKITEAGLAKISSGLLPVDTVLMSSRAPVGYLALSKIPVAVNQGYIALICEKTLSPEFALHWCSANLDKIKSRATGTTFAEISKKNFKVIPVLVPSSEVIKDYSRRIRIIYSKIENSVRESQSLKDLRDTLLPELLSGSLRIVNNEVELR